MTEAAGFVPHHRQSPFLDLIGPLLSRGDEHGGTEFALRIDERHVNARGVAHGAVLAALADVALGYTAALQTDPPAHLVTASLTVDFVGRVRQGDLLVADVMVHKVGSKMAFATCALDCAGRRVGAASAAFARAA